MPVIDGDGRRGAGDGVGTFTSEVTLVTEKDQSVPVMLVRNGLRAHRRGLGQGRLDRRALHAASRPTSRTATSSSPPASTAPIPPGLVVARVTAVEKNAAYVFAKITARPAAGVDNHRFVRMLTARPARGAAAPRSARRREAAGAKDRPGGRGRRLP